MKTATRPGKLMTHTVSALLAVALGSTTLVAQPMQEQARRVVSNIKLDKSTSYGLYAEDVASGVTLFAFSPDRPMMPASNLKVLTSAAALKVLGPEFKFKTELKLILPTDWSSPDENSSVVAQPAKGHVLVIKGDGDPSFGDEKVLKAVGTNLDALLDLWVAAVKNAGVTQVDRLIVDDRVFERNQVHPDWPKDQLSLWYCAPVAGLNINTNCFDIMAAPGQPGQPPSLRLFPRSPFLTVTNKATTGNRQTLGVLVDADNDLVVQGIVKDANIDPIHVTIKNPPIYFGRLLAHRLVENGITVLAIGRPTMEDRLPEGRVLHGIQTPIQEVLNRSNKDSQNLYAECLLKRALHQITRRPGSWTDGPVMAATLVRLMGKDVEGTVFADGSGLSRNNRASARGTVRVLASMYKDPRLGEMFANSMAIGGEDGTLVRRFKDLDATVRAKTGTISGVSALSGYVTVGQGAREKTVAFSFLFNDVKSNDVRRIQDGLVEMIARQLAAK
jgi:D-alanyl-D-alanine carboxypeptidase/D-alanyl-D-alanine-endopeptidase (penicillin-binding protein 4)